MRLLIFAGWFLSLFMPLQTWACWEQAAQRYGLGADLLYAIARVESNLNPLAVNRSHLQRTGSYDIGLMQINSSHLGQLARHGITEAQLYDPCTNIRVGAWLLAGNFSRQGATWEAVGAYNAACRQLSGAACAKARASFAWKVFLNLPAHAAPEQRVAASRDPSAGALTTSPLHLAAKVSP